MTVTEPIPDVVEAPPPPDAPPPATPPAVSVHQALAAAVAAMPAIPKADHNKAQDFNYRGIERIMAAAHRVLAAHGILTIPTVRDRSVETILVGKNQTPWRLVTLTVEWAIIGPQGDVLTPAPVTVGEGFDGGDKAASKAATMAFKTMLLPTLQIADGYDDPDTSAAGEPSGRQRSVERARVTPTAHRAQRRPEAPRRPAAGHNGASTTTPAPKPEGESPGEEVARVFGYTTTRVLVDARRTADQLGLALPTRITDIDPVVAEALATGYQQALADG